MPRRKAKASSSEDGPIAGPVMVASGSLRSPDESDALGVTLSISDAEISLQADGVELGNWPSAAVQITRIDSTSFEFVAEGDRLIFMPDDPVTFAGIAMLGRDVGSNGHRKTRRSKKKKRDPAEAKSVPEVAPEQKPPQPSRRDRRAAEKAARAEQAALEEKPSEPSRRERRAAEKAAVAEQVEPAVEPEDAGPGAFKTKRHQIWLAALDTARDYDVFGLDRVPVDHGLRDAEHQHSWDHRVAPQSGLGQRICTICGAFRLRTR